MGQVGCLPGTGEGVFGGSTRVAAPAEGAWGVGIRPGPVPLAPQRTGLPIYHQTGSYMHHRL